MRDCDLYARILGIEAPWSVTDVELDVVGQMVNVCVEYRGELKCPRCGKSAPGYDTRRRRWRHLDTCQYRTYLVAEVPRVKCVEGGVRQIEVPWADPGSKFTGIMGRAVSRGLKRRQWLTPRAIGIDETSYQ